MILCIFFIIKLVFEKCTKNADMKKSKVYDLFNSLFICLAINDVYSEHTSSDQCILSKEAKKAINRATSQQCKNELYEIACHQHLLYPSDSEIPPSNGCDKKKSSSELEESYLGCFQDSFQVRLLPNYRKKMDANSLQNCIGFCTELGFELAGVENSVECFCGDDKVSKSWKQLSEDQCSKKCPGDNSQSCGGYKAISIYKTTTQSNNKSKSKKVRIAYLFIVHGRCLRQILRLFKWLYHPKDYFYFHVDSRSHYLFRELKKLEKKSNIKVADKRIATTWGGTSFLMTKIESMKEIKKLGWKMDFVTNLSESDYLLKNPKEFRGFLAKHKGKNFIRTTDSTSTRERNLNQTFYECEQQMHHLGPRTLPTNLKLYGGSDWFSISSDFMHYLVNEDNQDMMLSNLYLIFNYTLHAAESFFHTAILNSPFCSTFVNNNLRLTNWNEELGCNCKRKELIDWCGCSPLVYKMTDWAKLVGDNQNRPALFIARKFDPRINQAVINQLDKRIFKVDYDKSNYFWENKWHYLDDDIQETSHLLAQVFAQNVNEVTALYIDDHLDSLLILHDNQMELRLVLNKDNVKTRYGDLLSIGSQFDFKELIFRGLPRVFGASEIPQLLIENSKKCKHQRESQLFVKSMDQESKAISVLWISPLNQMMASNRSLEFNVTLGHYLLDFPPHLKPMSGIWTAIYYENSAPEETKVQLEFAILPSSTSKNQEVFTEEPCENELEKQWIQELKNRQTEKLGNEAIDTWLRTEFVTKDQDSCELDKNCQQTRWSSRSPDPKSNVDFLETPLIEIQV